MRERNEIIEGLKAVCQCKGIKKARFKQIISGGAKGLADVQKQSGAGSGSCGGKRCEPKILEMLADAQQALNNAIKNR
ncbi:MAG: (2Fe-2S)-binding protein [Nitrospinae bacterium]|nr:(2Fe-2S)-binding protein [Nitrospinota bacterium]